MSVILVGNGPLSKDYGEFIDSHDVVIRHNDYKIDGYEKLVGTKITIHAHQWDNATESDIPTWDYRPKHGFCHKFLSRVWMLLDNNMPSCGFYSIIHSLEVFEPPINIIGYDFFDSMIHYDGVKLPNSCHSTIKETHYVEKLVEEGKVIWHDKGNITQRFDYFKR